MKMSKMIVSLLGLAVVSLMSGCSTHYHTVTLPNEKHENVVYIDVDQDSTAAGWIMEDSVGRTNYQYSFAVAATETISKGFTHFSIIKPEQFKQQLRDRKVTNVEEAYEACIGGTGSFQTGLSFADAGMTNLMGFAEEGDDGYIANYTGYSNNCDSILGMWKGASWKGTEAHRGVRYNIVMHNEDRQDNVTFNAKDVLAWELVKDLNKDWFVAGRR